MPANLEPILCSRWLLYNLRLKNYNTPLNNAIALLKKIVYRLFIGESFDEPRLATISLAMPVSCKGRLQQYTGRLHRLLKTKKEVRIYDYLDIIFDKDNFLPNSSKIRNSRSKNCHVQLPFHHG